ncbi:MAG: hypothetical protein J0L88_03980 [Xanthomonadales bacterium]|nr:hypothetical protein [Xanthomonadales bacterium]
MEPMLRLITLSVAILCSSSVFAQTCDNPAGPITLPAFGVTFQSVCTGQDEFNSICQGSLTSIGTSAVYEIRNPQNLEVGLFITVDPPATYDVAIFLVGPDSCLQTSPCVAAEDSAGPGGSESISIQPPLAAGNYYLVIDSTAAVSGCLPSQVSISAVPVTLQHFSIE